MAASEGVGILHDLLNYLEAEDDCSMYAKIITKKEDCRAAMRSKVEMGRASLQGLSAVRGWPVAPQTHTHTHIDVGVRMHSLTHTR